MRLIDADETIRRLHEYLSKIDDRYQNADNEFWEDKFMVAMDVIRICMDYVRYTPTADRWIPFKTRPLAEEEKEDHPEWDCILDCRLPDDGQAILVSINVRGHENVQYDEFFTDDGCYLDSGYEIGTEAIAWMPLPEPYEEKENEKTVEEKEI